MKTAKFDFVFVDILIFGFNRILKCQNPMVQHLHLSASVPG
jgi:hypothetical protein